MTLSVKPSNHISKNIFYGKNDCTQTHDMTPLYAWICVCAQWVLLRSSNRLHTCFAYTNSRREIHYSKLAIPILVVTRFLDFKQPRINTEEEKKAIACIASHCKRCRSHFIFYAISFDAFDCFFVVIVDVVVLISFSFSCL